MKKLLFLISYFLTLLPYCFTQDYTGSGKTNYLTNDYTFPYPKG